MKRKNFLIIPLSIMLSLPSMMQKANAVTGSPVPISDIYVSTSQKSTVTAPYEPASGVYLGMFVADDLTQQAAEQATGTYDPNIVTDGGAFQYVSKLYGKQPAIYLTYANFGEPFPKKFAQSAGALGGAVQIGWQPEEIVNGQTESLVYLFRDHPRDTQAYIHQFIADAKSSGVPIFLRFACEMNGDWTPWHSDKPNGPPDYTLYKQAWIDVWNEIHSQHATNVVMVFSPEEISDDAATKKDVMNYYPGDHYVDWIGESLYAMPYSPFLKKDNLNHSMVEDFQPLYDLFQSHGKPFMVSEGAAVSKMPDPWQPGEQTVLPATDLKDFGNWALAEVTGFLNVLPKKFPLVKAITYFNESTARTDSSVNDKNITYDLYENQAILNAYKEIVSDDLYLSQVSSRTNEAKDDRSFEPITAAGFLTGWHTVTPFLTLPNEENPKSVKAVQNGKILAESNQAPWNMTINFSKVDPKVPVWIQAFDSSGHVVAEGIFELQQNGTKQSGFLTQLEISMKIALKMVYLYI